MTAWLVVVGIGDDGLDGLAPAARAFVDRAEVLVGGERHLGMVANLDCERLTWQRPFRDSMAAIARQRGRRVVVLASGDPMDNGVGATLAQAFSREEMLVVPAVGAFSLACARMGWARQVVSCLTLHGRPFDELALHITPGARLLIMSEDGSTPANVAAALVARGYGESSITMLAHLGGPLESRRDGVAADWQTAPCPALNIIAVICIAGPGAMVASRVPGLPDSAFLHDGQLTKSEVRAASLAALMPLPGQHLWDLGAGCGAIAIEWLRAADRSSAQAVEQHAARAAVITQNACRLGVPRLVVIKQEMTSALGDLETPDGIFIGGGLNNSGLITACMERLAPGGRLVANGVTVAGEAKLLDVHQRHGGRLTRIAVSRAEPFGDRPDGPVGWRALAPITQWAWSKS